MNGKVTTRPHAGRWKRSTSSCKLRAVVSLRIKVRDKLESGKGLECNAMQCNAMQQVCTCFCFTPLNKQKKPRTCPYSTRSLQKQRPFFRPDHAERNPECVTFSWLQYHAISSQKLGNGPASSQPYRLHLPSCCSKIKVADRPGRNQSAGQLFHVARLESTSDFKVVPVATRLCSMSPNEKCLSLTTSCSISPQAVRIAIEFVSPPRQLLVLISRIQVQSTGPCRGLCCV